MEPDSQSTPLVGNFLISEVDLADPNFYRTVILVIHHDANGALGLVINCPTDITMSRIIPDLKPEEGGDVPIYLGGPVQPHVLLSLHSGLPPSASGEHVVFPIPHVAFEPFSQELHNYLRDEWVHLAKEKRPPVRLLIGYSGWMSGQLETELREGSWVVRPAAAKYIFYANPADSWRNALGEMGGVHRVIAETGFKPSLN